MKLSVRAAAMTGALVWGGSVLIVGVANLARPQYGRKFLELTASIYPGYKAGRSVGQVAVGTGYALVDGAVGGALCAWLYNSLASMDEVPGLEDEGDRIEAIRTAG